MKVFAILSALAVLTSPCQVFAQKLRPALLPRKRRPSPKSTRAGERAHCLEREIVGR